MCPTCGYVADPSMPMWARLVFGALCVAVALVGMREVLRD